MKSARVTDSRERILAAARTLFATEGVGAVSIRSIVRESGVNLAAVHYHFRSKEGLVSEVYRLASQRLNAERQQHLSDALKRNSGAPLALEDILTALYWPLFRRCAADDRVDACREYSLLAQFRLDPSPMARRILTAHENDVRALFDQEFHRTLPALAPRELELRIIFANAIAWDVLGQPEMIERVSAHGSPRRTVKRLFDAFLGFAVSGMSHDTGKIALTSAAPRRRVHAPSRPTSRRERMTSLIRREP